MDPLNILMCVALAKLINVEKTLGQYNVKGVDMFLNEKKKSRNTSKNTYFFVLFYIEGINISDILWKIKNLNLNLHCCLESLRLSALRCET